MALTTKDISTVVCEVINVKTGFKIEPSFEAYGLEKFQDFVDFYKNNEFKDTIVWVRGYGYEHGLRTCLISEFVGLA